ncbi:MAG: glycosyltransferase family 1 protein, partial [Legionellaceae bacterium]|nr:glycosyltransferase family 1 protein [Legionellaceae bacterium]
GIPRVILSYLQQYQDDMRVLVRIPPYYFFILSQDTSKEIALLLVSWNPNYYWKIVRLIIKGIFLYKTTPSVPCYLINLDLGGLENAQYIQALNAKNIRVIVMIYDLIPIINPEYCSANITRKFVKKIFNALHYAKGVISVSKVTQDIFMQYALSIEKHLPPLVTAGLAPGLSSYLPQDKPLISTAYFVTVGAIRSRKNHLLLLHVWRNLADRLGESTPTLVIIGRRRNACQYTIAMLTRCKKIQKVIMETQCSDNSLAHYLQYARALLFPSFAEGFGLPLVEALSAHIPVIVSDLPVFREIAGATPDYIDPVDGMKWMQYIEDYAQDESKLRQAQLKRMKNFVPPLWEDHFAKIEAFIDSLEE